MNQRREKRQKQTIKKMKLIESTFGYQIREMSDDDDDDNDYYDDDDDDDEN